jgi:hypothetical protein
MIYVLRQMKTIPNIFRSALLIAVLSLFLSSASKPGTGATLARLTPSPPDLPPVPSLVKKPTFIRLDPAQDPVQVFGQVQMSLETDGIAINPFDPAQIDIQVYFTSPQGELVSVPAFWYQDFDPATLTPKDQPGWLVRFTPGSAGIWTAQAEIAAASLTSPSLKFTVLPSAHAHGFVRINRQNPHYLGFDDGSLYFPIGLNIAWATSVDDTLMDYRHWFDELSKNGGNFARVWMASWSLGIEWQDTGLGDYTNRLKQAWLLDQVFQMAKVRGVYIMLTLLNHGAFSQTLNPEWSENPYNAALGGPLQNPGDFATNPQAKDLFKRRLRYISARYASSPNLMAWEWWNEVNWTPIRENQLKAWITEMDDYLKTVDPYQHLTTNSSSGKITNIWSMPELNIVQQHDYSDRDPIDTFEPIYSQLSRSGPYKPVILGEFGSSDDGEDASMDNDPVHFHNGLWAAAFTGFAGTGMYWWWDIYIDPNNLWGQLKGISTFLEGENLALLKPSQAQVLLGKARALTLQDSGHALVWIRSDTYNFDAAQKAYEGALKSDQGPSLWNYEVPRNRGLVMEITGLANGNYTASWFDPQEAQWLGETQISVTGLKAAIKLPDFTCDLAVKINRR